MKTKSIIAGMLSTMLLAVGCSKEHGGPGTPEAGVRTYASFSVALDAATTRALADVNSVEEEIKINTVNIYVFMGGVLEDTGAITLNENNEGTTTLATTTGPKTIYAVVNKSVTGRRLSSSRSSRLLRVVIRPLPLRITSSWSVLRLRR